MKSDDGMERKRLELAQENRIIEAEKIRRQARQDYEKNAHAARLVEKLPLELMTLNFDNIRAGVAFTTVTVSTMTGYTALAVLSKLQLSPLYIKKEPDLMVTNDYKDNWTEDTLLSEGYTRVAGDIVMQSILPHMERQRTWLRCGMFVEGIGNLKIIVALTERLVDFRWDAEGVTSLEYISPDVKAQFPVLLEGCLVDSNVQRSCIGYKEATA